MGSLGVQIQARSGRAVAPEGLLWLLRAVLGPQGAASRARRGGQLPLASLRGNQLACRRWNSVPLDCLPSSGGETLIGCCVWFSEKIVLFKLPHFLPYHVVIHRSKK